MQSARVLRLKRAFELLAHGEREENILEEARAYFAVVLLALRFGSFPIPCPLPPSVSLSGDPQEVWEREKTFWQEGGGGGRERAKSYDDQKAWSLIIHWKLSDLASDRLTVDARVKALHHSKFETYCNVVLI
jgi:hypothetical protein